LFFTVCKVCSQEHYLLAGTYDSEKSNGIYIYKFNSGNGAIKEVGHIQTSNPSYLAVSPDEKFVYAVNEKGDTATFAGTVSSFLFDKKAGALHYINRQPTMGNNPCYVATDKTGKWVFAGNYSSGNMVIFPVKEDGSLGPLKMNKPYTGSGPNKERQLSSHIHFTAIGRNNKDLFVTDLGSDKVYIEHFHERSGFIFNNEHQAIPTEPGAGPRHLDIDAQTKFIYVLEELSGFISVYTYPDKKQPELVQRIRSTPADYTGKPASADIHLSPDGRFLYSSNRGESNTIAIFSVDRKNGTLSLKAHQSTMGKTPRNFNFDPSGRFLLVANQNSNEIVVFRRNSRTGMLTDTGNRVAVGKPVCIKWVNVK
jgi:6-phosphogluconolactonase